jgi:hypothetical protein
MIRRAEARRAASRASIGLVVTVAMLVAACGDDGGDGSDGSDGRSLDDRSPGDEQEQVTPESGETEDGPGGEEEAAGFDECSLIAPDELAAAMGTEEVHITARGAKPSAEGGWDLMCLYGTEDTPGAGLVNVQLSTATDRARFFEPFENDDTVAVDVGDHAEILDDVDPASGKVTSELRAIAGDHGLYIRYVLGIDIAVRFNQVIGAVFILVLAVLAIGPFLAGGFDVGRLTTHLDGGWTAVVVWLYVTAWSIYGTELCASFAPEYRDTVRDTSRALRSIALFMVFAYGLVPLATTAQLGETAITENPITYGVVSVQQMFGGASGLVTAVLCGALFLSMISSSADAGRALFGIAEENMTITQFGRLNRRGMPAVALVVTMLVNLVIVVFVGNPVAILIASNIGYILAVTLAVIGFLLLRKDRPAWPRPIKLGRAWIPVAVVVAVFNVGILVIGATNPALSYAGGVKEVLIGLALLLAGVVLFVYRRLAQDRGRLTLREETPVTPGTAGASSA